MRLGHFLVLAAVAVLQARADLPVHCLRHQVAGEWEFTLGPLGSERTSCGHERPDDQYKQPSLDSVASQGEGSTVKFTLEDPATVTSADGNRGTWTMIYDEGFEVAIGGKVFFAFSNFDFVEDDQGSKSNISHCDATQVGWYHNTERTQWGCYTGRKVGAAPLPAPTPAPVAKVATDDSADDDDNDAPVAPEAPASKKRASLSAMSSSQTFLGPSDDVQVSADQADATKLPDDYHAWVPESAGYDNPMPSAWQETVAEALNFLQLGWKATAYQIFQGKTPRELNKFAGVRRSRPKSKRVQDSSSSFSSFLGLTSKVSREQDTFDWRQQNGQNYLTPVVTQGDCGSCYTIATVHMLTARHRIKTQDPSKPAFSVSFPLYCSEYNQGCDGGYGFLQSKWSEDVGLIPESCAAFSQGGGSCHAPKNCDLGSTRFRAHNHHYVGGYYGGSEEKVIRQELVNTGPVVMSFEPKEDFMYYKSGIYKSGPNKIHQEWEQVDHAVLLVGYGQDDSQPYWVMQNSWGTDWGEGGYFRMARGSDESGCESIVVAAEVLEEDNNNVLDNFLGSLQ